MGQFHLTHYKTGYFYLKLVNFHLTYFTGQFLFDLLN